MKLIVGLGNPGKKYAQTRHNAGWLALDDFADAYGVEPGAWKNDFHSNIAETLLLGQKILLAKPQTFMNLSGQAVKEICAYHKLTPGKNLLVVHDDIDLVLGVIRQTESSSDAGHNGVANIIAELGTQDFRRIRIGIETRASRLEIPTEAFVLQNIPQAELEKLRDEIFPLTREAIEDFILDKSGK